MIEYESSACARTAGRIEQVVALLLIVVCCSLLFLAARAFCSNQDMVQFWAAARLIKQNPYSATLVPALEKSVGANIASGNDPTMVTRNPPWALPFYLPLALLSYENAYAAWTIFSLVIVLGCGRVAWRLCTPRESPIPVFICLLFAPTLILLYVGQSTVLVLLGVTLFLVGIDTGRDWLAGSALLLVAIKPHISFLFLVAVFLWVIYAKRFALLAHGTVAMLISSSIVIAMNPHILRQYFDLLPVVAEQVPHLQFSNLGGVLARVTNRREAAMIPELIGITWLVAYWWLRRTRWDWKREGLLVLVVSMACTYYSFPYDEIIVLPALLASAARGKRIVLWTGLILTNLAYAVIMFGVVEARPGNQWWSASAWFLTYLLSRPPGMTTQRESNRKICSGATTGLQRHEILLGG